MRTIGLKRMRKVSWFNGSDVSYEVMSKAPMWWLDGGGKWIVEARSVLLALILQGEKHERFVLRSLFLLYALVGLSVFQARTSTSLQETMKVCLCFSDAILPLYGRRCHIPKFHMASLSLSGVTASLFCARSKAPSGQ